MAANMYVTFAAVTSLYSLVSAGSHHNRDTVGTFEMAAAFAEFNMITCIHKHYSVEDWQTWSASHPTVLPFVAVSAGTSDEDFQKTKRILDVVPAPFICLDVANGYSEHVRHT